MPQIEVHSSTIYIDPIFLALLHSTQMPKIAVQSSVIYPDPFLAPTPFYSKVPIAVHSSAIYPDPIFLTPTPFHSKAPNSSSLIYHLYRSNLFGPYSIPHKCPRFQFTHLPFIQIQSFWSLLQSTQIPQIEVHSSAFYPALIFLAPNSFHSNAPNCKSLICHFSDPIFLPLLQSTQMPQIAVHSSAIFQIQSFWPLLLSTQMPQIPVHSSAIYPDSIFLVPTPFHSKDPNCS